MPRPASQARAARKLRRENAEWIASDPDAEALAVQLIKLATILDEPVGQVWQNLDIAATANAYLATRVELLALRPGD